MEQELIITGYCKCIDGSRTVMVEEGEPDCLFATCPYANDCPIGQKIRQAAEQ
jgi:hypothetical protein